MAEFTGERVIPGEVEIDLLNEHLARYAFAARLARGKRVLDAGCGIGYGSAHLAAVARQVVGLEIAPDVAQSARERYAGPRLDFLCGDCRNFPFSSRSFDLVVAFEVIEHLENWDRLLAESRRVVKTKGEFIVSTPNRLYYAESREAPNPFHVHEFDYEEFRAALRAHFPHVRMLVENHSEGVIFSLPEATEIETFIESDIESGSVDPNASHFFVAVCSAGPLRRSPPFIYIPSSGNVLREREKHIALLQGEMKQKDEWLEEAKQDLSGLHSRHQALEEESAQERLRAREIVEGLEQELARRTEWCRQIETELEQLKEMFQQLQQELAAQTEWNLKLDAERAELVASYERLEAETQKVRVDLKACVDQLHATEATLEERTRWTQSLQQRVDQLTADLNSLFGSWAYRIGKRIGLAPIPPSDPRGRRR